MPVIDDYLATLVDSERSIVEHMYTIVRQTVPETTEELSYAMPSLKHKGKSLIAIMANKKFLSLYPFGAIEKLGVDVSAFEQTTGSIHFTPDHPITDELLQSIALARKRQIDQSSPKA